MIRVFALVLPLTIGCAFAGVPAPQPFCPPPNRLVQPGELVDTAALRIRPGLIVRVPVYTGDSLCVRARARDLAPTADTTPALFRRG